MRMYVDPPGATVRTGTSGISDARIAAKRRSVIVSAGIDKR